MKAQFKAEFAQKLSLRWPTVAKAIRDNIELQKQLKETGYNPRAKLLTAPQVAILSRVYGTPKE